jgi:hypothetical protein
MHANAQRLAAVLVLTVVTSLASPVAAQPVAGPGGLSLGNPTVTLTVAGVVVPPANTSINVTASGNYDMKEFGNVKKVTVEVQYKHFGDANWSTMNEVTATVPTLDVKGTYTAVILSVPFVVQGANQTKYRAKTRLYNQANDVVGDSTWSVFGVSP